MLKNTVDFDLQCWIFLRRLLIAMKKISSESESSSLKFSWFNLIDRYEKLLRWRAESAARRQNAIETSLIKSKSIEINLTESNFDETSSGQICLGVKINSASITSLVSTQHLSIYYIEAHGAFWFTTLNIITTTADHVSSTTKQTIFPSIFFQSALWIDMEIR